MPLRIKVGCAYFSAAVVLQLSVLDVHADENISMLQATRTIPLSGVEGRIDHFAFDAAGARLFVCALGNNTVELIDLRRGERVHSIPQSGSPQGVGYAPELNRLLVANDKNGVCNIFDAKSLARIAEVNLGDDADNVRYDAVRHQFLVGFGSGGIAVIDPATAKQVGSIALPAHPEGFVCERHGPRLFVNIPNRACVCVIDRDQSKVVATWRTDLALQNFPIALDEVDHRLFVGCRTPSRLIVLNTDSGNAMAKVEISGDPDDLFYDTKRHRIYAICGAGKIDVIEQGNADSYKLGAKLNTAAGARDRFVCPGTRYFVRRCSASQRAGRRDSRLSSRQFDVGQQRRAVTHRIDPLASGVVRSNTLGASRQTISMSSPQMSR
jgi:DNA-binding beta-propeller fold protein YncE